MDSIIQAIDEEIARLQEARNLIVQNLPTSKKQAKTMTTGRRKRRKMSAEARARIAEAQRKRWAKQKSK